MGDHIITNCIDNPIAHSSNHLDIVIAQSTEQQLSDIYADVQRSTVIQTATAKASGSPFGRICSTSISSICHFLTRGEMVHFKLTSRRIAIQCLAEMEQFSVSICDAACLLESSTTKLVEWGEDDATQRRYSKLRSYGAVIDDIGLSEMYNILIQIPIATNRFAHNALDANQLLPPRSAIVVFDKRKMTLLTAQKCAEQ